MVLSDYVAAGLAALVFAGGCGARSSLFLGDGAAGGGGGATSSASVSSGTGAAPPGPCGTLSPVAPVVTLAPEAGGARDDSLRLTFASDDRQTVATVFARLDPNGGVGVRHAALTPWQAWPTSGVLAPVKNTDVDLVAGPFVAPATGNAFALAVGTPSGAVAFYGAVNPFVNGAGADQPVALDGIDPEFVASLAGASPSSPHLVGAFGEFQTVYADVATDAGQLVSLPLGCGSVQPPSTSGVPFGDGWLVAASTGAPLGACPSVAAGDPKRIDVLAIGADGSSKPVASIPTGIVVTMALAPHPDGAYLVWLDVNDLGAAGLHAARIGAAETPVAGPIDVTPGGESGGAFSVAALGNSLVVGRVGTPGELVLTLYDESLSVLTTASFMEGPFSGPTSMLGSPSGDAVLVGWTVSGTPSSVQIERFDCGP